MSYFSGLSFNQGTKPGFKRANQKFEACFEGIECENVIENQANDVKLKFETCYNWEEIVEIILGNLEFFFDASEYEDDLQEELKDWLGSVEGWGLLFTLLPFQFQQFFLLLYSHINMELQEDNTVITNAEMYKRIKTMYESETQGLPFSDLIPRIEVKLLQIVGGPKEHERRKMLLVKFNSTKFKLIAKFSLFKKRLRRTLVEIAAEVVGQMVEDSEDLEIPETLKEVVSDKIIDADWVSDYWLAKFQKTRRQEEQIKVVEKAEKLPSDRCDVEGMEVGTPQNEEESIDNDSRDASNRTGVLARVYNGVRNILSNFRS